MISRRPERSINIRGDSASFLLVIGNKRYSSWSLRPWLLLKRLGVAFEEILVPLRTPEAEDLKRRNCPSGRVPTLHHGNVIVWESLAICEYLADLFPDRLLRPADPGKRAEARSIACEMHAGFTALRSNMPCNVAISMTDKSRNKDVDRDIARIEAIWTKCREAHSQSGPFLFGHFTIADAMFAPVAIRFRAYGVELPGRAGEYGKTMLALPAMQEWIEAGRNETWRVTVYEPPFEAA